MATYGNVINPSDRVSLETTDWIAACAAVLLVGEGRYAIESDEHKMPLFLFGGFEEWWASEFPDAPDINGFFKAEPERVCRALDSFCTGDRSQFEAIVSVIPEELRDAARERWQDEQRTSLNDITGRAWRYAKSVRAKAEGAAS